MRRILVILSIVILTGILFLSAGCSGIKISDIQSDPGHFEGKEVSIQGTVIETFWLGIINAGAYQINDGSGTIWVTTTRTPPDKGTQASVKGKVTTAVKIGDKSLGTTINETSRK